MASRKGGKGKFLEEYLKCYRQEAYQFFGKDSLDYASQDHGQPYIIRELFGEPVLFPREIYEWAEEYIYRTEKFDRVMCGEDGIPKNDYQRSICMQNARKIKQEYVDLCRKNRYDVNILNKLIRDMDRDLERIMKKYEQQN